ncbi:MAG: tyrosine-type recombinase/integrase [Nitrospirota bacterium]
MALHLKKGNWFIDYYAYGKRKRKKIGPSKALAENVLRKLRVEIAENKYLDIKKEQKIKFEDFADEYLELHSKPNNKSWFKSDRHNVNNLKAHFSGRYLHEITPLLIEKYKVERSKEVSPATVNRNLACLKSMFNRAIEWDKAQENPVRKVKLFRENNKRLRYLEREEIVKLLANCKRNLKPIVVVALNTGMRKGEILGLKWHDVDFKRGIIYLLNTKNGEKREIPMNEQVKTALIRTRKHAGSPYIFCRHDGKPYGDIKKSFFTAMKKSDIINFRFHDLRHTFASQLVMSGIDLNTVRELLGHKSLEMTLRYSHLSPDHKKRAVDTLARRLDTFWTPVPNTATGSKELVNTTL